jgi:transcriptional regulator with XRE-family HTH domain
MEKVRRRRTAAVVVDRAALRLRRQLKGLDQAELAELAGVSSSYVGHIESGRRPTISPKVFVRICDALGVEDRTELMAP